MKLLHTLLTVGLLASPLLAQEAPSSRVVRTAPVTHDLARARALFTGTDVDGDSKIDLREATRFGITARQFSAFDSDGSGSVDSNEFVVGYRSHVLGLGQRVAPDLDAEATRLRNATRDARTERSAPAAPSRAATGPASRRLQQLPQFDGMPARLPEGVSSERVRAQATGADGGTATRTPQRPSLPSTGGSISFDRLPPNAESGRVRAHVTGQSSSPAPRTAPVGPSAQRLQRLRQAQDELRRRAQEQRPNRQPQQIQRPAPRAPQRPTPQRPAPGRPSQRGGR